MNHMQYKGKCIKLYNINVDKVEGVDSVHCKEIFYVVILLKLWYTQEQNVECKENFLVKCHHVLLRLG